jgi:hypothetical protein
VNVPDNEHASAHNHRITNPAVSSVQLTPDSSKHNQASTLPQPSNNKRLPPPISLNKPQPRERAHNIHSPQDNLSNKTIRNPDRLENRGPVVEKVVCPSQLLERLQRHPEESTVEDLPAGIKRIPKVCLPERFERFDAFLNFREFSVHVIFIVLVLSAGDESE